MHSLVNSPITVYRLCCQVSAFNLAGSVGLEPTLEFPPRINSPSPKPLSQLPILFVFFQRTKTKKAKTFRFGLCYVRFVGLIQLVFPNTSVRISLFCERQSNKFWDIRFCTFVFLLLLFSVDVIKCNTFLAIVKPFLKFYAICCINYI